MANGCLVHASNFRKIKRVNDVIRIFHKVNEVIPSRLMMVGDGPERPPAEALCRELGICDQVRFVGKQEQMEEILVISDLFLLPSEYESFGLKCIGSHGCPCTGNQHQCRRLAGGKY